MVCLVQRKWCVAFFCNFGCHWVDRHPSKDSTLKRTFEVSFLSSFQRCHSAGKRKIQAGQHTPRPIQLHEAPSDSLWPQFPHGRPALFRSPAASLMGCDGRGRAAMWEKRRRWGSESDRRMGRRRRCSSPPAPSSGSCYCFMMLILPEDIISYAETCSICHPLISGIQNTLRRHAGQENALSFYFAHPEPHV